MFYSWGVLSRELSAYMFLNRASVGAGLLLVCVGPWWYQQAAPWNLQELWRCVWNCSVSQREALVCLSLWREILCVWLPVSPTRGSSPVPPQLLTCCSPFPGSFSGESRMTNSSHNPLQHKLGSNLPCVIKKCEFVCVGECLHHLFPFLQLRVRLCVLCSAHTGACAAGVPHDTAQIAQVFPLEHTKTWAQVCQCSAGRYLFW